MTTNIEWVRNPDGTRGKVWNPVTGCDKVSPGCKHCYAETMAGRFWGTLYPHVDGRQRKFTDVILHHNRLATPLTTRAPTTWFVNSVSDLFHRDVPNEYIAAVFGVMDACPQHKFQILTKRSARLPEWFDWVMSRFSVPSTGPTWLPTQFCADQAIGHGISRKHFHGVVSEHWPLPNVHLGVSVESQDYIGRIGDLLKVTNAVPWVSAEPLLGPLELAIYLPRLKWVVTGAESGHGARPMDEDWVRSLRDQCAAADVPFFYKQNVVGGRKSSLPILDGVQHMEMP